MSDIAPDMELHQCFPETTNFPMHVDVWLIVSDEEVAEVAAHAHELGGLRKVGTLFSRLSFRRGCKRRSTSSTNTTPSSASGSMTELQRAKSDLLVDGMRRLRSSSLGTGDQQTAQVLSALGPGESKLQRRMTVSGSSHRKRRDSDTASGEGSVESVGPPGQIRASRDSLRTSPLWQNSSFGNLPLRPPASPSNNTYVEIVDRDEARRIREQREEPAILHNLSPAPAQHYLYTEIVEPRDRDYAQVAPPTVSTTAPSPTPAPARPNRATANTGGLAADQAAGEAAPVHEQPLPSRRNSALGRLKRWLKA